MSLRFLVSVCVFVGAYGAANFRGTGNVREEEVDELLRQELADKYHHVARFEDILRSMYMSLPRNSHGNLGHETARYALRRHFMGRYGWLISGLESEGVSGWIPAHVVRILEGTSHEKGIDLHRLAMITAILEDLTERNTQERLRSAFNTTQVYGGELLPADSFDYEQAKDIMETYLMMSLSPSTWKVENTASLAQKKDYFRQHSEDQFLTVMEWYNPIFERHLGHRPEVVTFHDLTAMAANMDKDFHTYFDGDCKSMKTALLSGEGRRPGRVRLAAFYNMSLHDDWYFTEKEEYLRALGALDESNQQLPSVIIANYALARINCLNETSLYSVCCRNKCEDIVSRIEDQVHAASAPVETLLSLIKETSTDNVVAPRELSPELTERLHQVADHNGGQVPLHGRLFAQWLHHAFPLDCPFPHEAGVATFESPEEWTARTGETNSKTVEEILAHVAADTCTIHPDGKPDCGEEDLDLPWSMTEELLAPPLAHLSQESQAGTPWVAVAAVLFALAALAAWPLVRGGIAAGFRFGFIAKAEDLQRRAILVVLLMAASAYTADLLDGPVFGVAAVSCVFSLGVKLKAARLAEQTGCLPTAVKMV